jgi:hypothetical protein
LNECTNEYNKLDRTRVYFIVTHPFHPLYKQKFILIDHRRNWGEDRVFFVDSDGEFKNLPTGWTSVRETDPFLVRSRKRSYFHIEKLIELAALVGISLNERGKNT